MSTTQVIPVKMVKRTDLRQELTLITMLGCIVCIVYGSLIMDRLPWFVNSIIIYAMMMVVALRIKAIIDALPRGPFQLQEETNHGV